MLVPPMAMLLLGMKSVNRALLKDASQENIITPINRMGTRLLSA